MIYRGPGFLRGRKIWLHAHPLPHTSPSVSSISDTQEDCERDTTCGRESGRKWVGVEPNYVYDWKKAYSSKNNFLLSLIWKEMPFSFSRTWNILADFPPYTLSQPVLPNFREVCQILLALFCIGLNIVQCTPWKLYHIHVYTLLSISTALTANRTSFEHWIQ